MMKINQIINVVFILLTIILSAIPQCWSTLSDKQLCYDPDCSEPISLARTSLPYNAVDKGILSFNANAYVTVYSKTVGNLRDDLWGVEINGKRGYAPKLFLREYKVHHTKLQYEVPIKSPDKNSKTSAKKLEHKNGNDKLKPIIENVEASSVPITTIDVQSAKELPNNATPTHEVIDGTTLHLNPTKTSTQTSATEVPQKPVVPNKEDTVVNFKVDSKQEDHETNIFVIDDKLQHKILNGKEEDGEQNSSQKDNTNDVRKSAETTLGDLIGMKIPTLGIGANLINQFLKTADEKIEAVENETTSEVQDVKIPKAEVPPEAQNLQLTKDQSVSEVQEVKVGNEQDLAKKQEVEVAEAQDVKVAEEQDVKIAKEKDVKVTKEQDVKVTKEQNIKEQSVSEIEDVKIAKVQDVSQVHDIKVSNEQVPPKAQNVQLTKEKSVSKEQDAKVSNEQVPPETQNVQLTKEKSVSELQEVKVGNEQDLKVAKEQEVEVAEEQDVKVAEEQDVKVAKEKDVKVTKEQDVKVTKEQNIKEQSVSEIEDVKIAKEQDVSQVHDIKVSNEPVPLKAQNVQLTKEKSVSKEQDAKVSNEQVPSETQNVQLTKEKSVSELQEVKVGNEQDLKVAKEQEVEVAEEQDVKVAEDQDVKVAKEKDVKVTKEQDVKVTKEQNIKEQSVSEIEDVKIAKVQDVSQVHDIKVSNEQVPPETQNVQLTEEKSVSKVQDVKIAKERTVTENQDVQLSKEQSVSEAQGVKTAKEDTGFDTQVVELQEKHSTDNTLNVSTANDSREEQTDNILNTTVASTATVLNETGHTDLVQTVSANSSEIDANIALNITEPTNTEYVQFVDNTQFETRQAKLVENDNISESNSTSLGIKHDVPVPTGTDVYSSTELPSLNIDRNIGQQSSNINFDTASHQPDSKYSGNVEININSQDTRVNEENTIATGKEEDGKELQKKVEADVKYENQNHTNENTEATESEVREAPVKTDTPKEVINLNDNTNSAEAHHEYIYLSESVASINEFRNRNLLNAHTEESHEIESVVIEETEHPKKEALLEHKDDSVEGTTSENISSPEVCATDNVECSTEIDSENNFINHDETSEKMENIIESLSIVSNYWMTFMYLIITATATLIFSLGYYYIENMRRDGQLIAKINKLEKDLLVSTKESTMLKENLKITKDKLTCIEDESFGSNEMVLSLKADLEASQNAKSELEDQVSMLEKDLESATEAGLELERMLREVLSSDNEDNPLAQSVEDLQTRLNAQQAANESLTSALNIKTQENESLSTELASFKKKCEELEVELIGITNNLKREVESKNTIQQTLTDKVQELEIQLKDISNERITLQKQLKCKEMVTQDLMDVINQSNSNLDLDKLYNATHIKAEAQALLEERNELKIRLTEVEGAHSLLEEHMKVIKEEVSTLSEQCKAAEKEKKDAETRLEVLSNFFKEREAQRQKEESIWLQQQGEVVSTVERIQTMQSEIQNYKQQIEMLKREILDQEREYENQISIIETKAREQWIKARQVERRLEESKVEAGQLRNRLTLIEKNINDVDPEAKLHRMEANGETATSPPLFIGAESSSSPIMFSGSSNVPPPPPPSYLHSLFPPYLPPPLPNASNVPPYEISQRPPPLGGRLSSPPPMPLHPPNSSRYDNTGSPPPISPHLLPSFPNLRIPPPPFGNDHMPGPPPPPLGSIMPAPLGTPHSWGEEPLTPLRNSGYHLSQRERVRNHKGSLHSSGESLDKSHHNSKV